MPRKPRIVDELPNGPKCGDCPYREWSRGFTRSQLYPEAEIVLLGEASGYWEIYEGVPFAGMSGAAVNVKLGIADLTRLDCSVLNTICCRPIEWEQCPECRGAGTFVLSFDLLAEQPELDVCSVCHGRGMVPRIQGDKDHVNARPSHGQITECMRRYGHDALKSLTGKRLIVGVGASSLYALSGLDDVGSYRGSVIDTPHGPALITYHPSYLKQSGGHMDPAVCRDFSRIPAIVSGAEGAGLEISYIKDTPRKTLDGLIGEDGYVLDLETTGGKDPNDGGDILLAAMSRRPGEGIVIPAGDDLRRILQQTSSVTGQYFYSYDAWWLRHRGYPVPDIIRDTQVLGHLANPNTPNDIGFLQSEFAEPPAREYWKTKDAYANRLEDVAIFDVDFTKRVEIGLIKHLKYTGQWDLAEKVIIPWCRIAHDLRWEGIRCDLDTLRSEAERIKKEVWEGGANLAEETGCPMPKKTTVGIPGPLNVQKYLYEVLKLPKQYHPKTHKPTVDEPRLRKLRTWCYDNNHKEGLYFIDKYIGRPNPEDPTDYLPGLKQFSTLGKDYAKYAKFGSEWLHAEPNLTGTVTGRLSYLNPNLQQVPPTVRHAFLPDNDESVFLNLDYKQVEYLVLLYKAHQFDVLKLGLDGKDFHKLAASAIFNVPFDKVSKQQRKAIKPINLGMLYGKGVKSTARDMEVEESEVKAFFDAFHKMVPGMKEVHREWVKGVETLGYMQTQFGWRRYFTRDERKASHRGSVTTEIYNTPVQSDAGMVTRQAIVNLDRELKVSGLRAEGVRIVLTVHDSVLLSVPRHLLGLARECAVATLTAPVPQLPCEELGLSAGLRLPVDVEVGENWGSLMDWEKWHE